MNECPSEGELRAFHNGDLPEPDLDRVADHTESCARCSARLEAFETHVDPVFVALRGSTGGLTENIASPRLPDRDPTLPGYEILGLLGEGGMGIVYRARHLKLNRTVAVKFLRGAAGPDTLERFRTEAEAVARLQHPNIVQIFEVGEYQAAPYLTLELVDGGSLDAKLAGKPQPARDAASLVEILARAADHAHQRGLVHRDLKPANVLLQADRQSIYGTPRITDFGIAKRLDSTTTRTQTGVVLGTPAYMAPEQAAGKAVGPAADVYALGAILYEMLTGRPPFGADSPAVILQRVLNEDPVPPSRLQAVPRDLETICLKCLEKDPGRRYASAGALADDLARFRDGRSIHARPAQALTIAWKWARRRPGVAATIVVGQFALIVMVGGALWYSTRLNNALNDSKLATERADANAKAAREAEERARNNAEETLRAHRQLVDQVRDKLPKTLENRNVRQALLQTAADGLAAVSVDDGPGALASRIDVHRLLGELHSELGHPAEGIVEFEMMRQSAIELANTDPTKSTGRHYHSQACARLSRLHLSRDEHILARERAVEAVAVAESWRAESPTDIDARSTLAEAYEALITQTLRQRDLPAATSAAERMRDFGAAIYAVQPPTWQAIDIYLRSLSMLGTLFEMRGILTVARDHKERSVALARIATELTSRSGRLQVGPQPGFYRYKLMMECMDLVRLCIRIHDLPAARQFANDALATSRQYAKEDATDANNQFHLFEALYHRAWVEQVGGQHAAAVPFLRECQEILTQMSQSGKLTELPRNVERAKTIANNLLVCERFPRALANPTYGWQQPVAVAYALARDRLRVHVRDGKPDEASKVILELTTRVPADAAEWLELAMACSAGVEACIMNKASGLVPRVVDGLRDRGIEALSKAIAGGQRPKDGDWAAEDRIDGLRDHSDFARLTVRKELAIPR